LRIKLVSTMLACLVVLVHWRVIHVCLEIFGVSNVNQSFQG